MNLKLLIAKFEIPHIVLVLTGPVTSVTLKNKHYLHESGQSRRAFFQAVAQLAEADMVAALLDHSESFSMGRCGRR